MHWMTSYALTLRSYTVMACIIMSADTLRPCLLVVALREVWS